MECGDLDSENMGQEQSTQKRTAEKVRVLRSEADQRKHLQDPAEVDAYSEDNTNSSVIMASRNCSPIWRSGVWKSAEVSIRNYSQRCNIMIQWML